MFIVNWRTIHTRRGMNGLFCRDIKDSGVLEKCKDLALWYNPLLPVDGSDKVIIYEGWKTEDALLRHNNMSDIPEMKELFDYYVNDISNEWYQIDKLILFDINEIKENIPGHIAGCVIYKMIPGANREEFIRKAVMSGIYNQCRNDAETYEFLLPFIDKSEIVIMERWKDKDQMLAHCESKHVTVDLKDLKKDFILENSCMGFRYDHLKTAASN